MEKLINLISKSKYIVIRIFVPPVTHRLHNWLDLFSTLLCEYEYEWLNRSHNNFRALNYKYGES